MQLSLLFLLVAVVAGGAMAYMIGANNAGNGFGTVVGAGALSVRRALITGAFFELVGGTFVAQFVSATIRKGIVDSALFVARPLDFSLGMMCALVGGTLWLIVATALSLPVSTSHAIVGGIVGFSAYSAGLAALNWRVLSMIVASWVISPCTGGLVGFLYCKFILWTILKRKQHRKRAFQWAPFHVSLTICIMLIFIIDSVARVVGFAFSFLYACAIGVLLGIVAYMCTWIFVVPYFKRKGALAEIAAHERLLDELDDAETESVDAVGRSVKSEMKAGNRFLRVLSASGAGALWGHLGRLSGLIFASESLSSEKKLDSLKPIDGVAGLRELGDVSSGEKKTSSGSLGLSAVSGGAGVESLREVADNLASERLSQFPESGSVSSSSPPERGRTRTRSLRGLVAGISRSRSRSHSRTHSRTRSRSRSRSRARSLSRDFARQMVRRMSVSEDPDELRLQSLDGIFWSRSPSLDFGSEFGSAARRSRSLSVSRYDRTHSHPLRSISRSVRHASFDRLSAVLGVPDSVDSEIDSSELAEEVTLPMELRLAGEELDAQNFPWKSPIKWRSAYSAQRKRKAEHTHLVEEQLFDEEAELLGVRSTLPVFFFLQILAGCFVSFAHAANDVPNATGPLGGIVEVYMSGTVGSSAGLPLWVFFLASSCLSLGILMWGRRMMRTVGEGIALLTPTGGYVAQLSTALTAIVCSRLGMPISTTHVLIGAVMGVGLARRGFKGLRLMMVGKIIASWLVTLPAAAGTSIALFALLRPSYTT